MDIHQQNDNKEKKWANYGILEETLKIRHANLKNIVWQFIEIWTF